MLARTAVYGSPSPDLVETPEGALQTSPLRPGSTPLESLPDGVLEEIAIAAPPGAVERRYVLAQGLRALAPGGRLLALAPKDKGGARLHPELSAFGCDVFERFKARQRICETVRPAILAVVEEAIAEGAPRLVSAIGLWSQPGVFSFDRIDPGSALLAEHLPPLSGRGADLGAGIGFLSLAVLRSPTVASLDLVEIDRRALDAARRNVSDARAAFHWNDARAVPLAELDFVVANPPFHTEGQEDRGLGQGFVAAAGRMLRRGGAFWLVANRHMPYEAGLKAAFRSVELRAATSGFKVLEARK